MSFSWNTRGHNKQPRGSNAPTHSGQANATARKRALREALAQQDQAEAAKLGITVDQLRQLRFRACADLLPNGQRETKVTQENINTKRVSSRATTFSCQCGRSIPINGPGVYGCGKCGQQTAVSIDRYIR